MLRELEAGQVAHGPAEAPAPAPAGGLSWSREASQRLAAIPDVVRSMARTSIEQFAREHGYEQVTEQVLDRARSHFGL
jgi:hypothetical protein